MNRWEDETISLQLLKSRKQVWCHWWAPKILCLIYSRETFCKHIGNSRHSRGSLFKYSLPRMLCWHPSSFSREKIKIPISPLCLIALIASVTWWELKQYVLWCEDSWSIWDVRDPSRYTREIHLPFPISACPCPRTISWGLAQVLDVHGAT